jgi:membrane-associated protease RseP (regulator of RpoE activity)
MPGPGLPRRGPQTPFEWWFSAGALVLILGLFLAAVFVDFRPEKLMALFIPLFWIVLLPIHEAGHAVVAGLCGWYVGQVVIGWGKPWARFRWGRAQVEIRTLPFEGFVRTVPTNLNLPRLKSAFIYFAGPGAELLILGILVAAIGPSTLLTLTPSVPLLVAQSLALAIVASAFINLLPHSVMTEGGPIANDGLGILNSFLVPESYFAEMIGSRYNDREDQWEEYDPADWWKRG